MTGLETGAEVKNLSANKITRSYNISEHSIQNGRTSTMDPSISYEKAKEQLEEDLYELSFYDRVSSQNIYLL